MGVGASGKAAREVESAVKRQRKHVRQHVSDVVCGIKCTGVAVCRDVCKRSVTVVVIVGWLLMWHHVHITR